MPVLVKPFLGCNQHCEYCYETAYKKANPPKMDYDLDAVLKALERYKSAETIALHGGEPLCMPKKDVAAILAKAKSIKGSSSIQTNASLIDQDFIDIFKENKTRVGISCDGPGELNRYRNYDYPYGGIMGLLEKLQAENIHTSIICVISKSNAGSDRHLSMLLDWLLELKVLGVGGRLNPCGNNPDHELPMPRLIHTYNQLSHFCLGNGLRWSPLSDIVNRLRGESGVCTFMECDPFHTESAIVILGDGSETNCMRTNQGDIVLRHPAKHLTRSNILKITPQEYGGCRDCEFWEMCYGGCPSMALENDWRNRDHLCELWKSLFALYSNILKSIGNPRKQGKRDRTGHIDYPEHSDSGR
jgi:uncharacterized protein